MYSQLVLKITKLANSKKKIYSDEFDTHQNKVISFMTAIDNWPFWKYMSSLFETSNATGCVVWPILRWSPWKTTSLFLLHKCFKINDLGQFRRAEMKTKGSAIAYPTTWENWSKSVLIKSQSEKWSLLLAVLQHMVNRLTWNGRIASCPGTTGSSSGSIK
jgi:hypothetical protein